MKLATYATLSPESQGHAVATLVAKSMGPPNGQLGWLETKIKAFEQSHGMTTAEMVDAFKAGRIEDTSEVAQWLILAKVPRG